MCPCSDFVIVPRGVSNLDNCVFHTLAKIYIKSNTGYLWFIPSTTKFVQNSNWMIFLNRKSSTISFQRINPTNWKYIDSISFVHDKSKTLFILSFFVNTSLTKRTYLCHIQNCSVCCSSYNMCMSALIANLNVINTRVGASKTLFFVFKVPRETQTYLKC